MRTSLAPYVSKFLNDQLTSLEGVSENTRESYTTTYVLLFNYMAAELGIRHKELAVEDLTSGRVGAFLNDLEVSRSNGPRTRNLRLAAVKRLAAYIGTLVPSAMDAMNAIEAIPPKRFDRPFLRYLLPDQVDAILAAPDLRRPAGVRDHAMIALAFNCGLRATEVVALKLADYDPVGRGKVRILGKGRRLRELPLWRSVNTAVRRWVEVRPESRAETLFLNRFGQPLTRHGFASRLAVHVRAAAQRRPDLDPGEVTPHTLRHSCAMHLLDATGSIVDVSLWLGHANVDTTQIYLHADPHEKLEMIKSARPPNLRSGVFPDAADRVRALFADS